MTRFKRNRTALRELERQPEFQDGIGDSAERVRAAAAAIARSIRQYGQYSRSLRVRGNKVFTAETTDPAGHIIEFGSVKNPPFAPLRRAIRAAGLRLREAPKK